MARFMIKASEYKNVCKAVNDRKLAELKKEIIEILKKQDEKDFKKATDYLNSQEEHFTHLEKSLSGKWIEKAGYGIGTVRVWKGKKYKKIAPNKWVRVFDKEGRGTNIAIGKLIAKVNKIDNVEDLMAFVMANKQRFVDDNGIDLPVLDKLRAAVDAKNNGTMGSKTKEQIYKEEYEQSIKDEITRFSKFIEEEKPSLDRLERIKQKEEVRLKTAKEEEPSDGSKGRARIAETKLKIINQKIEEAKKKNDKPAEKEKLFTETEETERIQKGKKIVDDYLKEYFGNENVSQNLLDIYAVGDAKRYVAVNTKGGFYEKLSKEKKMQANEFNQKLDKELEDYAQKRITELKEKKPVEKEEPKTYWIQDSRGNRLTNEDAKSRITDNYMQIFKLNGSNEPRKDIKIRELKNENEYLMERLNPEDKAEVEIPDYASKLDSDKSKKLVGELEKLQEGSETNEKKLTIGTFSKVDDKTVEMSADKSKIELFENLKSSCSDDKYRQFMTDVYYDGENLVSTDGRRLTIVKAGNIGIEPGYVSVKTDDGKITLERNEEKSKENQFPNYSKVIPNNNNQEVKLNNKALKEKLKAMKKEGAWSEKNSPQIALDFEDGKVMLDGTQIGTADGVKFDADNQRMIVNAKYLSEGLSSGDVSNMFVANDPTKAMVIKTDVSDSIIMPMHKDVKVDYDFNRGIKAGKKADKEAAAKRNKENNLELCKVFESKYGYDLVENMTEHIGERLPNFSDEDLQREYNRLGLNFDKLMEKKATTINSVVDKKTGTNLKTAYLYQKTMEKHPEVKDKLIAEMEKRGLSVKKSLFDDFVIDNFIEEDIDDIEEEKEEESLWNDYSAEQPELFNSVELQVREALNRRYCNCM